MISFSSKRPYVSRSNISQTIIDEISGHRGIKPHDKMIYGDNFEIAHLDDLRQMVDTADVLERNLKKCREWMDESSDDEFHEPSVSGIDVDYANELDVDYDDRFKTYEKHDEMVRENNKFILAIEDIQESAEGKESSTTPGYMLDDIDYEESEMRDIVEKMIDYLEDIRPKYMFYKDIFSGKIERKRTS